MAKADKPLGQKSYGHIPHLPGSRMGPADHKCSPGQLRICTEKVRDKHDTVIVQEKVDGSNVGVAKIDGRLVALTRAGYTAESSPFEQHHWFAKWVAHYKQSSRFNAALDNGQRMCGEWLLQAHGTRYSLSHEPFVAFDIMQGTTRMPWYSFSARMNAAGFVQPHLLWHCNGPCSIERAMERVAESHHGAIDPVEGCVWRVERDVEDTPGKGGGRHRVVDFLAKYVRPDKVDGKYLESVTGKPNVWNVDPETLGQLGQHG